jgi:predicted ester cyclase
MNTKDFAERFIKAEDEAWMKGNVDALDEVENPDVVYHLTPPLPDVVGRDAHKQFILAERKAHSDIKFDIKYLIGEGNLVGFLYQESRSATIKFFGQLRARKVSSVNELWLFHLKNDKVSEAWMYGRVSVNNMARFLHILKRRYSSEYQRFRGKIHQS